MSQFYVRGISAGLTAGCTACETERHKCGGVASLSVYVSESLCTREEMCCWCYLKCVFSQDTKKVCLAAQLIALSVHMTS